MVERYKYKCIDAYEEPENPMEWLPCPRCGLRPLVWEFDNGRATACGCGDIKIGDYIIFIFTRHGREEDKNVPKKRQVY